MIVFGGHGDPNSFSRDITDTPCPDCKALLYRVGETPMLTCPKCKKAWWET